MLGNPTSFRLAPQTSHKDNVFHVNIRYDNCGYFAGLPQRATQYSLPWVWRALRDHAAALSTTIPLKWDNGKKSSLISPLFSLNPSSSPPNFTPPPSHLLIPTHCLQLFTLSWRDCQTLQPQATLSYELVISLSTFLPSFALSVFCSVTHLLALSPTCPSPCVQSGVWFTSTEIWCFTLKAEQRQGHMEKYLQAVSHWLIAQPCPHLQPWWFLPNVIVLFPLVPPVLFTWVSGRNGVTVHRYEMESIN